MYTQCPDCLTIYKIGAESLAGGRGSFRCGHCGAVFDALPSLIEKLPLEVVGELPRHPPPDLPPLLAIPAMHPKPKPVEPGQRVEPGLSADWLAGLPHTLDQPVGRARFLVGAATPARSAAGKPGSAAARARAAYRAPEPPSRGWVLGCVLLALGLGGQIAYAERARLLAEPRVRGVLDTALGWVGKRLPPLVDPAALTLMSRDVRPHATVPGALLISASMRNDSAINVAYPRVEIRMTDLAGKPVALRRFTPDEYLNDPQGSARGLEPDAIVPLVFEVVDPGRAALNFEFAFRAP